MQNTSFQDSFPYLYRGIVIENNDPKNLGRCKIKVPSIHGGEEVPPNFFPWARGISNIVIGKERGSSSVPDIGDIVWVLFEGGDTDYPVYLGGTHGTHDIPVNLEEVVLYQEGTNRILYNREESKFYIDIEGNSLSVGKTVEISGNVNISGSLTVNGKLVSIE